MKHFCRYKWGNHGEDFVFYEPLLKVASSVIFRGKLVVSYLVVFPLKCMVLSFDHLTSLISP